MNAKVSRMYVKSTSEAGQGMILFLLALVAIIVCLYVAYTGISELAGAHGGLFETMLSGISEVIR